MGCTLPLFDSLLHDTLLQMHLLPYSQHKFYALRRNPSIKQSVEELKQTTGSLRERQAILLVLQKCAQDIYAQCWVATT